MDPTEAEKRVRIILSKGHPFVAIASASYELSSGLRVLDSWNFDNTITITNFENYFLTIIGNIYRKSEQNFTEFQCERVDFQNQGISSISTLFSIVRNQKKTFYSLTLFQDLKNTKFSPYVNSLLYHQLHTLGFSYKKLLIEASPDASSFPMSLSKIFSECKTIVNCDVKPGKLILPNSIDEMFYNKCLTSHLQTQMTTIIETPNLEASLSLYSFLSHFLLPEQQSLSDPTPHHTVIPGLFLQCVTPQPLPHQKLFQFKRPWTWVNVSQKEVHQYPNIDTQKQIFNEYTTNVLFSDDSESPEAKQLIAKLTRLYQKFEVFPTQWSRKTIDMISSRRSFAERICEERMLEMVNMSILLVNMIDETLANGKLKYLQTNQINSIMKLLELNDKMELRMVCAVAELFQNGSYSKVFAGRNQAIRQMMNSI